MRSVAAMAVAFLASAALAAPPTDPDRADEYCEDLARSGDASIDPAERVWFSENCICREDVGCGMLGSARWTRRTDAARAKEEKRLAEERKADAEASAAQARVSKGACAAYATCLRANAAKVQACDEAETAFEYACSATIRDVETCVGAVQAMRAAPDKAECIDTFR